MPDLGIPPTLSLDGFRDGIVISHLLVKFQALVEGNKPEGEDAPTLAGVLLNGDRQTTAYIAGLSIAEALFGRMHSDDELVRHSGILYGQALKRLQSDIRNIDQAEVRARSFMNLWSTTFLGLYEIMMASTPMSWLEHSRGLSALVSCDKTSRRTWLTRQQTQSLGPRAFTSASARRLFYSNRLFIVSWRDLLLHWPRLIASRRLLASQPRSAHSWSRRNGRLYRGPNWSLYQDPLPSCYRTYFATFRDTLRTPCGS